MNKVRSDQLKRAPRNGSRSILHRLTDDEPAPLGINDLSVLRKKLPHLLSANELNAQPKTDALLAAINKLTSAMTAPKTIVTDSSGKPIGIKVA